MFNFALVTARYGGLVFGGTERCWQILSKEGCY